MRAVVIDGYGDASLLHEVTLPVPSAKTGSVLVKIHAAGVNPADVKWRAGMFSSHVPLTFPHVLGYDIAGRVVEGEGFPAGTRVFGMLDPVVKGGYAEYAVVPAGLLARVPEELDLLTAAAIPTAGLTGLQLVRALGARSGQRVAVTGARGFVGRFALQALKAMGVEVVAAVRARQCAEVMHMGADAVVAVDGEGWHGPAFDGMIDTIGGQDAARLAASLRPGGRLLTVATTPIPPEGLPGVPTFFSVQPNGEDCARLAAIVAAGEVDVPVAARFALEEAARAHRLLEAGGLEGKVLLIP